MSQVISCLMKEEVNRHNNKLFKIVVILLLMSGVSHPLLVISVDCAKKKP